MKTHWGYCQQQIPRSYDVKTDSLGDSFNSKLVSKRTFHWVRQLASHAHPDVDPGFIDDIPAEVLDIDIAIAVRVVPLKDNGHFHICHVRVGKSVLGLRNAPVLVEVGHLEYFFACVNRSVVDDTVK